MARLRRTALLSLCILILVAGCRGVWPRAGWSEPDWVEQPASPAEEGRFVTATAVAGPGEDAAAVIVEADRAARARLGEAVTEYTQKTVSAFLEQDPELPPPDSPLSEDFMVVLGSEVSASVVRRASRQDTWETPNGRAYVLYRVPLGVVHGEITSRTAYILEHVNPFGGNTAGALAGLEQFLEHQLHERLKVAAVERPQPEEAPPEDLTPRWLQQGRHENYPAAGFYTTIGLGETVEEAEASARRELKTRLTQDARQLLKVITAEPNESALSRNASALSATELAFTEEDLASVRVAERWYDTVTDTHYAYAALDRSTSGRQLAQQVADLKGTAGDMLAVARDHVRAGNTAAAIRRYLSAVETARKAAIAQIKAMTLAPLSDQTGLRTIIQEPILPETQRGITVLLKSLTVERLSGNHQWVAPGVPPAEPFRVRVTARPEGTPVPDLPLRLKAGGADGRGVRTVTNAEGVAEWRIADDLPLDSGARHVLHAEVAIDELAGTAQVAGLAVPGTVFTYLPRSSQNARVFLHVRERTAGGTLVTTPLEGELRVALEGAGYRLVDEAAVPRQIRTADLSLELSDKEIVERLSPLLAGDDASRGFTLVVVGQVEALIAETLEVDGGNLCIAHCEFEFRVIDGGLPEGRRTILTVEGRQPGAYLEDQLEALRRARAEAASEAARLLLKGLRGRLKPALRGGSRGAGA